MIRGVVFDLGETLLHFEGDWERVFARSRRALIEFLRELELDLPEEAFSEALRRRIEAAQEIREEDYVERPAREIVDRTLREFGVESLTQADLEAAVARMFSVSEDNWIPVPKVQEILAEVADEGWRMGLISNASDVANVERLIKKAGVRPYFDPILISAGVGLRKPAVAIFEKLLRKWQLAPADTVMVGDTLGADILGAQRVGMKQIWLKTAVERHDNQALLGEITPDCAVDRLAEVPAALRSMNEAGEQRGA